MSSESMQAVFYEAPRQFTVKSVDLPTVGDDDVLIKVSLCGVCGTDGHIHEGEFIAKFPLIPGHEVVGAISKVGKNVKSLAVGDRVVADNTVVCEDCFYCRRGKHLLCLNMNAGGVTFAGGFADYVVYQASKCFKFASITDEEATLIEPTACALHGLDQLNLPVGSEVLVLGSGPTALVMAQLLKLNGAAKVVICANKGIKTKIARELNAGHEYIELDRENPRAQWDQIKVDYPFGFDAVIEATGNESVAHDSINYVRRGGSLLVYGVYADEDRVHWPPSKIFGDEIRIIGSFAQMHCFPRAVHYLDNGLINVKGMVTDVFKLDDYQGALDKMNSRTALKIAIRP